MADGSAAGRDAEIQRLLDSLADRPEIADAWTAKSFTDRLLVVDVREDETLPTDVGPLLADHGFRGANEVYETSERGSFLGDVPTGTRHQFVDVETRGTHQSYVVEE
jgi:hypothetical protein